MGRAPIGSGRLVDVSFHANTTDIRAQFYDWLTLNTNDWEKALFVLSARCRGSAHPRLAERWSLTEGVRSVLDSVREDERHSAKSVDCKVEKACYLEQWLQSVKKGFIEKADIEVNEEVEGLVLSKEEAPRRRLRYYVEPWLRSMPLRWAYGIGYYLSRIPVKYARIIKNLIKVSGINEWQNDTAIHDALKKLGDIVKKNGKTGLRSVDSTVRGWKYFVDLNTLGGYRKPETVDKFVADVTEWVTANPVHSFYRDEDLFLRLFEEGCHEFMQMGKVVRKVTPLPEFLASLAWATAGASTGATVTMRVDHKTEQSRRSKWATAFHDDPNDVLRRVKSQSADVCRANPKREAKKVRPVMNAGLDNYIRMCYLDQVVQESLQGRVPSTLFMSNEQAHEMWEQAVANISRPELVKVPIDQSSFDHQMNVRMRRIIMRSVLPRHISRVAPPEHVDEMLQILRNVDYAMENTVVTVGDTEIKAISGVLSGWKWTAFIDTLINYGEFRACQSLVRDMGIPVPVANLVVQGDDDLVTFGNVEAATAVLCAYNVASLPVNPAKFFVSRWRDEFLRRVIDEQGVAGYPARSVLSIQWRNPVNMEEPKGAVRVRSLVENLVMFVARGADMAKVAKDIISEVKRGVVDQLSDQQAIDLLGTPVAYGGLGLSLSQGEWLEYFGAAPQDWLRVRESQWKSKAQFAWVPRGLDHFLQICPEEARVSVLNSAAERIPTKTNAMEFKIDGEISRVSRNRQGICVHHNLPTRPGSHSSIPSLRLANESLRMFSGEIMLSLLDAGTLREHLDADSQLIFDFWRRKCSAQLVRKLVDGKIGAAFPLLLQRGKASVSSLYDRSVCDLIHKYICFSPRRVSYGDIRRVCAEAEIILGARVREGKLAHIPCVVA